MSNQLKRRDSINDGFISELIHQVTFLMTVYWILFAIQTIVKKKTI